MVRTQQVMEYKHFHSVGVIRTALSLLVLSLIVFSLASGVYASEVTGNLSAGSSAPVSSGGGGTGGTIGGNVSGGSSITGTVSGGSSGGSSGGGSGGGGGGGSSFTSVGGSPTFDGNVGSVAGAFTQAETPTNGSALAFEGAGNTSFTSLALDNGTSTGEESIVGQITDGLQNPETEPLLAAGFLSGFGMGWWFWSLLILIVLLVGAYLYWRYRRSVAE